MRRVLVFILTQCSVVILLSQNQNYARKIVDTLSSSYFEGRGAEHKGEKKAADYIASEYKRLGLSSYNNSYFQEFNYPINTITGDLSVQLDNTKLIAGEDYIVDANSNGIIGKFDIIWYNKTNLPTKQQLKKLTSRNFFTNKFIVIDESGNGAEEELIRILKLNVFAAAGVIFLEDKLTQTLSNTYQDYAILRIRKDKISRNFKSITLEINQKFIRNYQSQNVIGFVQGTEHPDSIIVASAHYDHLGRMGNEVFFPGANDNASGVAMLLNLIDHYTRKEPPKKTMVFIAFGAEEAGLIGSKYFVNHPLIPLDKINFVFNMDLMGTGSEGAMIVNGAIFEDHYNRLTAINKKNDYLTVIKKRGKAANSDHYWFSEKGIPAFFIYTMGGIKAYHDIDDISKTLPLTEFEDCFRLIRDFIDEL